MLARLTEVLLALQPPAAAQDAPDQDAPMTPFSDSSSRMSFSQDRRCALFCSMKVLTTMGRMACVIHILPRCRRRAERACLCND